MLERLLEEGIMTKMEKLLKTLIINTMKFQVVMNGHTNIIGNGMEIPLREVKENKHDTI